MLEKDLSQVDATAPNAMPSDVAPARGRRYAIRMAVRYRTESDLQWQEARTVNISRTGVLLRTNSLVDVHKTLQMILVLPAEIGGDAGVEVICLGHVVRVVPPRTVDGPTFLAATISDYQFLRK